ncbi:MAG: ribonuclease T2-like protein [Monoraphidium minutum]|nr:MAG: ribonuclease T2-like protein [Monoraphidium minutum]
MRSAAERLRRCWGPWLAAQLRPPYAWRRRPLCSDQRGRCHLGFPRRAPSAAAPALTSPPWQRPLAAHHNAPAAPAARPHPPRSFRFTIHGMWPQRGDGTWPEFCDPGAPFSLPRILDLLPRMARNWPSWAGPNTGFWAHEWTRHGTCAQGVVGGERSFFKAVLGLHKRLVIEDALTSAGIGPSGNTSYDGRALHAALKDGLGTYHHIFCDMHGNLAEIWSCIGLDLQPFDCGAQQLADAAAARARRALGAGGAPSNNACGMRVRIPPLDKRYERDYARFWAGTAAALAGVAALLARWRVWSRGQRAWAGFGGGAARSPLMQPLVAEA